MNAAQSLDTGSDQQDAADIDRKLESFNYPGQHSGKQIERRQLKPTLFEDPSPVKMILQNESIKNFPVTPIRSAPKIQLKYQNMRVVQSERNSPVRMKKDNLLNTGSAGSPNRKIEKPSTIFNKLTASQNKDDKFNKSNQ